ncbi:cyanophycinase [Clostridium tetani]|uniref:cyanophycinase n=1 Tax=Clostridium tetani TaxID=1513 RepID=UPI002953AE66|nr:cyanophycinase [Clostridium tetani]BDR65887.1 cyanophycinase [Clostridium tetani]
MEEKLYGNLIIIGGAEDKKGDKSILKEISSYINHEESHLIIATVASEIPEKLGIEYKEIFKELNVKKVSILQVKEREDAFKLENINLINNASAVFFTGGDQLRITSMIGGTPLYKAIHKSYKNGCIYIGTSAGASVMSDTMIVSGPNDESPRKYTLKMAPGLGLIKDVIIDQHFAQRGRIGRLLVAIAQNPQIIGIGIDEDTAIIVNDKASFRVIGSGAVYILDGSEITKSNVSEQKSEEILSIFNIRMHVLKKDDKFDLSRRIL